MVQKNKKMLSRNLKTKTVNFIISKGNKCCAEKLLKKSFKYFLKTNKKEFKKVFYLALNYCLPIFKIENQKTFNKRKKVTKLKPNLIKLNNGYRSFFALKIIIKIVKLKKNSFSENLQKEFISIVCLNSSLNEKFLNQEQALVNKSALIFYRWY